MKYVKTELRTMEQSEAGKRREELQFLRASRKLQGKKMTFEQIERSEISSQLYSWGRKGLPGRGNRGTSPTWHA